MKWFRKCQSDPSKRLEKMRAEKMSSAISCAVTAKRSKIQMSHITPSRTSKLVRCRRFRSEIYYVTRIWSASGSRKMVFYGSLVRILHTMPCSTEACNHFLRTLHSEFSCRTTNSLLGAYHIRELQTTPWRASTYIVDNNRRSSV